MSVSGVAWLRERLRSADGGLKFGGRLWQTEGFDRVAQEETALGRRETRFQYGCAIFAISFGTFLRVEVAERRGQCDIERWIARSTERAGNVVAKCNHLGGDFGDLASICLDHGIHGAAGFFDA